MKEFILKDVRKKLIGYDGESNLEFDEYSARYMDEERTIGYPGNMFLFFDILCSTLSDTASMDELLLNIELILNDLEKRKMRIS